MSVLEHTKFLDKLNPKFKQRVKCILNDVYEIPTCKCGCGVEVKFYWNPNDKDNCFNIYLNNKCARNHEEVENKRKETCIEKYGVDNPSKTQQFIEQQSERAKNQWKNDDHRQYMKQVMFDTREIRIENLRKTFLEKYGVENISHLDWVIEKRMQTIYDRFDGMHSSSHPDIHKLRKKRCIEKRGVEFPMQDPKIFEKQQKSLHSAKEYILPSGKVVKVRGYEPRVLDILFDNGYKEEEIFVSATDMPRIWYKHDGKKKKYYPDIWIPSENFIIEVKSTYTYYADLEVNLLKQQACIDMGYKFLFVIL